MGLSVFVFGRCVWWSRLFRCVGRSRVGIGSGCVVYLSFLEFSLLCSAFMSAVSAHVVEAAAHSRFAMGGVKCGGVSSAKASARAAGI